MIVKDEEGNDIEVLTSEEAQALAEARAVEVAEAKQAELDALAAEREAEKEELEKLRNKDFNFESLRKSKENAGKTDDEVRQQLEAINQRLEEVAGRPIVETKEEFIRAQIGDDKEKRERFDYYFKKLGAEAKSKDEVLRASQEALSLASGGDYKPNNTAGVTGTSVSQNYMGTKPTERGESFGEIASLLGNTPDDIKKYGDKK